jgi:hypothetical protein
MPASRVLMRRDSANAIGGILVLILMMVPAGSAQTVSSLVPGDADTLSSPVSELPVAPGFEPARSALEIIRA